MQLTMNQTVTPIFGGKPLIKVDRERFIPDFTHSYPLPLTYGNLDGLEAYLAKQGMDQDARALWVGYPNLYQAVTLLLEWVTTIWPSKEVAEVPAVYAAVEKAILQVRNGLARNDNDRRFVIANFHNGLASIAHDINASVAWGCQGRKAVSKWVPFVDKFPAWAEGHGFDKIIFSPRENLATEDHYGLVWKMRGHIAPTRDIGVIHRYGER